MFLVVAFFELPNESLVCFRMILVACILFALSATYATGVSAVFTHVQSSPLSGKLQSRDVNNSGVTLPLKATYTPSGTVLDVEVTVGGQNFSMFLDTGSSDIYLPKKGFQCINATDNSILPQESCLFNKVYEISPTFEQIQNQSFGVKYGSGIASGIVGYEEVIIGGLRVEKQEIGVADRITDVGDGNDSGVLGLAYPYLTSAHPGTQYPNESLSFLINRIPYNPLFTNLYKQGSVKPFFSISINRNPVNVSNGDGGFLGLGTLPPVPHKSTFAVAPVERLDVLPPIFTNNEIVYTYWALSVKSTIVDSVTMTTSFQAIVDTGNFYNYVPTELASSINNAFHPPATKNVDFLDTGSYSVSCNATSPTFGLTFSNNETIYMDSRDMLLQNSHGTCTSAFVDADVIGAVSGITFSILGTPFLQSVVSVWDFGNDEMRFAKRIESGGGAGTPSNTSIPVVVTSGVRNNTLDLFLVCLLFTVTTTGFLL